MQRHLLVTISDDPSAMLGVRFLCRFFRNLEALEITLLYIAPDPRAHVSTLEYHQDVAAVDRRLDAARHKGQLALDQARDYLLEHGFVPQLVHQLLRLRELGTARDILREGVDGMYDAVVLGRRGSNRLLAFAQESMSQALVSTRLAVPLWACHAMDHERRHVLLAVDGSEAALRAADHVGFMVAGEPEQSVTVTHILKPGGDQGRAEALLAEAGGVLQDNGLPVERIRSELLTGSDRAGSLLDLFRRGNFAVLALGRTGANKPAMQRLFMGTETFKLLQRLETGALWVSH